MRFLVDESAGAAIVEYLRGANHDVVSVAEQMPQADDDEVLAWAVAEGRILITNDKDFGELVFRNKRPHRGIVLLRLADERSANRVKVMRTVIERWGDKLPNHFTVATERGIRIR